MNYVSDMSPIYKTSRYPTGKAFALRRDASADFP